MSIVKIHAIGGLQEWSYTTANKQYNIIKRTIKPYELIDGKKNEHFKKTGRSTSLIANSEEYDEVSNLIL